MNSQSTMNHTIAVYPYADIAAFVGVSDDADAATAPAEEDGPFAPLIHPTGWRPVDAHDEESGCWGETTPAVADDDDEDKSYYSDGDNDGILISAITFLTCSAMVFTGWVFFSAP